VLHALGLDPTEIRDRLTVASGRAGEASLNEEIRRVCAVVQASEPATTD
jgi:hypothetical protein